MKYSTEIEIKAPREEVVKKFIDPTNKKHWQQHFKSMEPLSDTLVEEGAKTKLRYEIGGNEIEIVETVKRKDLPTEFRTVYESNEFHYFQDNFFENTPQNHTRWIAHHEYTFSGSMKLKSVFSPASIRKQTNQDLENFKAFVENETSLAEE